MFVSKMISLSVAIAGLISSCAFAADFPRGCEVTGFGYDGPNLIVNEKGDQSYYLVQNRSNRTIELQRIEDPNAFMTPSLTAKLLPENWAALSSDVSNLNFQCFHVEESGNVKVDCREVIDICQYPRVKFALSNMGNYWVSINKSRQEVINDSVAKGIYLKW
jgi:hypothetical protein